MELSKTGDCRPGFLALGGRQEPKGSYERKDLTLKLLRFSQVPLLRALRRRRFLAEAAKRHKRSSNPEKKSNAPARFRLPTLPI